MGLLLVNGRNIRKQVMESIGFNVILKENIKEADIYQLQKVLDAREYILSTEYITKEEAALETEQMLGEDFIRFLGYNPLPATIVIYLHAEYALGDSIQAIKEHLLKNDVVREVNYQGSLVELVNRNIARIGWALAAFSGVLLLISILLIYNTIRLAIYARRFLIKSMLLVGATTSFVRRPFIVSGILQGMAGGAIAVVLLAAILYLAQIKIPEITILHDLQFIVLIMVGVVAFGTLITWLSNFFAVKKYLKTNSDALY